MTDYKRKYEEALERAKQFSEKPYLEDSAGIVEYIFPELKESDDERIRKELICFLDAEIPQCEARDKYIAWLEKKDEQKPAEWSKADEDMIYNIRNMIFKYAFSQSAVDVNGDLCESEYIEADQWLRSLEDRCISQPKQEWSKEDENNLNSCIAKLEIDMQHWEDHGKTMVDGDKKLIEWLKSLRPQSQWKPSTIQMNALESAIEVLDADEDGLTSLFEQLKKLREG